MKPTKPLAEYRATHHTCQCNVCHKPVLHLSEGETPAICDQCCELMLSDIANVAKDNGMTQKAARFKIAEATTATVDWIRKGTTPDMVPLDMLVHAIRVGLEAGALQDPARRDEAEEMLTLIDLLGGPAQLDLFASMPRPPYNEDN